MRRFGLGVAGLILAGVGAFPANAATVSDLVTFTASGFTSAFGQAAPTDPVNGSFTITFDPTMTYTDETVGITLKSLNITLDSALSFDYSPTGNPNGLADELVVGGLADGAASVQYSPPTNDFWLHIYTFTASPTFQQVGYSNTFTTDENLFYTDFTKGGTGSVTVTSVPEPSTWAMMLLGFVGLGYVDSGDLPRASQCPSPEALPLRASQLLKRAGALPALFCFPVPAAARATYLPIIRPIPRSFGKEGDR